MSTVEMEASSGKSPRFHIEEKRDMIGNILWISEQWEDSAYYIVRMLLHNCLMSCKQMGIEPIGSLEMDVGHDLNGGDYVRYIFTPDE